MENNDRESPKDKNFASELYRLVIDGLPLTFGYLLQVAVPFSNTYFLGTLGTKELGSGTLAIMIFNCTGLYVGWGALLSMDTLMSQAVGAIEGVESEHNGEPDAAEPSEERNEEAPLLGDSRNSTDPHLLSVLLQRAILFSFLLTLPILAFWVFTPAILRLLGQDPELSDMAGKYVLGCAFGLFPNLVAESQKKYLQSLGWMRVHFMVQLFSTPQHVALAYYFTNVLKLGFIGPAFALSVTYALQPFIFWAVIYFRGIGERTWGSWGAFRQIVDRRGVVDMLKLAIPGVFMLGAEYWAYEVIALAAGLLSQASLAAQSVILLTMTLTLV